MNCPRCNAPRSMIGWACGHNGDFEHDREEDLFWEDWAKRMGLKKSKVEALSDIGGRGK